MLTVCCFLWHDPRARHREIYTYGPEHVSVLASMVRRNLMLPHKFVVMTDNCQQDFGPGVEVGRMSDVFRLPGTRFTKLQMFARNFGTRVGGKRILYLDLDTVVVGNLDAIAGRSEDLVLWRNPNFGGARRALYNTSIMLLTAGTRPEIFETFDPSRSPAMLQAYVGGTDQAWISHVCRSDEAHWTDADGVFGAGRLADIVPGVQTVLPPHARVVFFPGRREPSMREVQQLHPWIAEHRY